MHDVRGKRVTVAGLGRFGGQLAAAKWLVEQGANVLVTDTAPANSLTESIEQLRHLPIEWRLGEHVEADFTTADLIVASPAIPPASRYLSAAREAQVEIITEIMLFIERCPATIVGVTGTKGKSTTTMLLEAMLRPNFRVFAGGNIGRSLLPDLSQISKQDIVVLELSSFMLHYLKTMKWSPHIAVITMVTADHIEWHLTREGYVADKHAILQFQRPDDFAVINEECVTSQTFSTAGRIIPFSGHGEPFEVIIPGEHNQQNVQAAFTAASLLGVSRDVAQRAIRQIPSLPHRLSLVHEHNGVRYFDDSIATIPEAAIAALAAFPPRKVIQIVGGSNKKKLPFTALCEALIGRAKAALCIGETGDEIAKSLENGGETLLPVYRCGDLAAAIKIAKTIATEGDIVLLSTGCASYDQFTNFEARGNLFAKLACET
jgi:UDP-N-acetylmuramoylalanine--D-glutamate ligase